MLFHGNIHFTIIQVHICLKQFKEFLNSLCFQNAKICLFCKISLIRIETFTFWFIRPLISTFLIKGQPFIFQAKASVCLSVKLVINYTVTPAMLQEPSVLVVTYPSVNCFRKRDCDCINLQLNYVTLFCHHCLC